jgi:DNA polymerase-3 subunit epsilon
MPRTGWPDWLARGRRPWPEVLWAVDLETTGLHARRDRILAVGMVPVRNRVIRYGERFATFVRPPAGAAPGAEGLRAHHLLPADLAGAPSIEAVLPEIDRRLREGGLLVHHAAIDVAFLRSAYRRGRMRWPAPRVVDTADLLWTLHRRRHRFTPHPPAPRIALAAAREQLGLPPYPAHDALLDALAAAELFLVLQSRLRLC